MVPAHGVDENGDPVDPGERLIGRGGVRRIGHRPPRTGVTGDSGAAEAGAPLWRRVDWLLWGSGAVVLTACLGAFALPHDGPLRFGRVRAAVLLPLLTVPQILAIGSLHGRVGMNGAPARTPVERASAEPPASIRVTSGRGAAKLPGVGRFESAPE